MLCSCRPRRNTAFELMRCFSVLTHLVLLTTIVFYLHSLVTPLCTVVVLNSNGVDMNKGFAGNDTRAYWMKFEVKSWHMHTLHVIYAHVHTVCHEMT